MADAFRKGGLTVREVEGWKTYGRPYSFAPRGVVFHHTASNKARGAAPALPTVIHGRPDLPGPLCHALVGRDGTVYTIAAGRANHAGLGGPWSTIPKDSANSYMAGVEVENDGLGEPWPDQQLDVCAKIFAILLLQFRRTETWLIGHKEWAPDRKIDPAHVDMNAFRRRVGTVLLDAGKDDDLRDAAASSDHEYPGHYLEPGMRESAILRIKQRFENLGYRKRFKFVMDDFYGPHFEQAVREFQKDRHLDIDGIIGPKTWETAF